MTTKPKNDWKRNNIQYQALLKSGKLDKYLQNKISSIDITTCLLINGDLYDDIFEGFKRFEMLVKPMVYNKDVEYVCELSVGEMMFQVIKNEHYCITKKDPGLGIITYHVYDTDASFDDGTHKGEHNISVMDLFIDMETIPKYKPILKKI